MNTKKMLMAVFAMTFLIYSCDNNEGVIEDVQVQDETAIPGQYIVKFKDGAVTSGRSGEPEFKDRSQKIQYSIQKRAVAEEEINTFFADNEISSDNVERKFTSVFSGFAAKLTPAQVAALQNDPRVEFIEQDRIMTLDFEVEAVYEAGEQLPSDDNNGRIEAQTTTCAISNAGGATNGANKNTWIWIVDTGIDLDHPDLNVNTQYSRSFADGSPDDSNGHGTHVAGIAAAKNNNSGVVGVSAGATVVAIDVLGSGSAPTSSIIAGMDYVAANDISGDAVNMSLGPRFRTGCSGSSSYRSALDRLNNQSRVALAAGNSSDDARFYDPACQNLSRVYTVASMTCGKGFSSFSNYGTPVDWIATGSSVTSTYRGGGYATLSGTSMASPVVAGILHARNGAPRQCGTVSNRGITYKIACR